VIRREFHRALDGATALAICGSALGPLSVPLVPEFVQAAKARGIPTLVDTYGEALRLGVQAAPTIVKGNRSEMSACLGRPLDTLDDLLRALAELQQPGAQWAIITLGEEGALFAAGEQRWVSRPPAVQAVNPMGSGDAMTAALLTARLRGWTPEECFRYGMAAAVANVTTFEPCRITVPSVEEMRTRIIVEPVRNPL
jgi:fructose-1-phosphate kinase PfkB-like protein